MIGRTISRFNGNMSSHSRISSTQNKTIARTFVQEILFGHLSNVKSKIMHTSFKSEIRAIEA